MQDILRKPEGIRVFRLFLETFKNADLKSTGLGALEQVLAGGDQKYSEVVRRIFSNLVTPHNFPQQGPEGRTLDWILDGTKVPFEGDELQGCKIMLALTNWDWGLRLLCAHTAAIQYITDRSQIKPNDVLRTRYEIATRAIQSPSSLKLVPDEVLQ